MRVGGGSQLSRNSCMRFYGNNFIICHPSAVSSGDTIGSLSCSVPSMHIYVVSAYMDSFVCISVGDPNCGKIILCAFTCHMRADFHKLRVSSGDTIELIRLSI